MPSSQPEVEVSVEAGVEHVAASGAGHEVDGVWGECSAGPACQHPRGPTVGQHTPSWVQGVGESTGRGARCAALI
jgi:hypothetical protein